MVNASAVKYDGFNVICTPKVTIAIVMRHDDKKLWNDETFRLVVIVIFDPSLFFLLLRGLHT